MTMASNSVFLCFTVCWILCILQTSFTAIEAVGPAQTVNLTYYLHETLGGPGTNGTLWVAAGTGSDAQGNNASLAVGWGTFFVFDSPLKNSPNENGTVLGKSTGTAVVTTKGGIPDGGVQVNSIHIFNNASMYYKSSITVTGQVDFLNEPPWECIVPGGTGYFRGWRGHGIVELLTSAQAALVVYKWSIFLSN